MKIKQTYNSYDNKNNEKCQDQPCSHFLPPEVFPQPIDKKFT